MQDVALFLDFRVDGYRVIVFPETIEAKLVGVAQPIPAGENPSLRKSPRIYIRGKRVENARNRLAQEISASLARSPQETVRRKIRT
jgi:hypothetical protein